MVMSSKERSFYPRAVYPVGYVVPWKSSTMGNRGHRGHWGHVPPRFTNSYIKCPFSAYIAPVFASKGVPECMCPHLLNASYVLDLNYYQGVISKGGSGEALLSKFLFIWRLRPPKFLHWAIMKFLTAAWLLKSL